MSKMIGSIYLIALLVIHLISPGWSLPRSIEAAANLARW